MHRIIDMPAENCIYTDKKAEDEIWESSAERIIQKEIQTLQIGTSDSLLQSGV